MRVVLGLSYLGTAYEGWQSQPSGCTVQDHLERALQQFVAFDAPMRTICAGRTDAGVHALMQVVHFDAPLMREEAAWVRGTNTYLPRDIAVQWARIVPKIFHARSHALRRRYVYLLRECAVRPSLESGRVGWVFRPLANDPMQQAAQHLLGTHDFSSFRAARCQALSPIKTLYRIAISFKGAPMQRYWRFEFEGDAFLHHMIRNIMGGLIAVGQGKVPHQWLQSVLQARDRRVAAPTFSPEGLYFWGPMYDPQWQIPTDPVVELPHELLVGGSL